MVSEGWRREASPYPDNRHGRQGREGIKFEKCPELARTVCDYTEPPMEFAQQPFIGFCFATLASFAVKKDDRSSPPGGMNDD